MPTRELILDAARVALNDDPTLSMAGLAAAVGVGRATLHRHFSTREELLHEIGERSLERWQRQQEDCDLLGVTATGDADAVRTCLQTMLVGFVATREDFDFALTDPALLAMPDLAARSRQLQEREIAFLAVAQERGVLRRDVPAAWLSHVLYGLLVGAREAARTGDVALRPLADLLTSTFLQGAAPR